MAAIIIPEKIHVGFQKRENTMTGMLAYVTYEKNGVLESADSWNNWKDKSIPTRIINNEPQEGFLFDINVVHKNTSAYGTTKRLRFRIHSPMDFDFEVYPENVIDILSVTDVSKKYIDSPCVLAWKGKKLMLLSTASDEYVAHINKLKKKKK